MVYASLACISVALMSPIESFADIKGERSDPIYRSCWTVYWNSSESYLDEHQLIYSITLSSHVTCNAAFFRRFGSLCSINKLTLKHEQFN